MNMLNEIQQNIANTVMASFKDQTPKNLEIAEKTSQVAAIFNYADDIDVIVKSIESTMNSTMEVGVFITEQSSNHDRNWIQRIRREEKIYSLSYENLLRKEGKSPVIVDTISKSNDDVLGLLDDPKKTESFQRRGLVIGDVQSGKTGNYLSLVTKAADAGYRFIIIIAGIHNNLRRQTQQRVDAGFVGRVHSSFQEKMEIVGVGKNNTLVGGNYPHPVSLTTQESDFNSTLGNRVGASLSDFKTPLVLVIKKNTKTLESLYTWLKRYNKNSSTGKIDEPMIMIDDESDNASINTKKEEDEPSPTNMYLRKILNLFSRGAYIGYTATPFANIFMDPESYGDAYEDLFPRDFIYCLNSPTNYFGPQKIFLNEDFDENTSPIIHLLQKDEVEKIFPPSHKKTLKIKNLPESLKKAILTFLVVKAIRNLRGQVSENCSMLINVSTFVNVQEQIKNYVNSYITAVGNELLAHGLMLDAENHDYIKKLKEVYQNEFVNSAYKSSELFDWDAIKIELVDIFSDTQKPYIRKIFVVNSKSQDALDYDEYNKKGIGLMAVAIGGFSLSRGLTIEGLTVSYFFRNTKMYDTLLQMGRWFGYRPYYEDLCRIFMTKEAYYWYQHITRSAEDLRDQVANMNQIKLTPRDFGLYVTSSEDGLLVTARNKSRRGKEIDISFSFSGQLKEFDKLSKNSNVHRYNYELFKNFWEYLNSTDLRKNISSNQADVFQNVATEEVIDFITKFDLGYKNDISVLMFYKVVSYLTQISNKYSTMDVSFMTVGRKGALESFDDVKPAKRKIAEYKDELEDFYRVNKSRIGSQEDEKYGLSEEQRETCEKNKANFYRRQRNRPLLLLYLIEPKFSENSEFSEEPRLKIPTFALSFPHGNSSSKVTILANQIYNEKILKVTDEDYIEEEEDENEE